MLINPPLPLLGFWILKEDSYCRSKTTLFSVVLLKSYVVLSFVAYHSGLGTGDQRVKSITKNYNKLKMKNSVVK